METLRKIYCFAVIILAFAAAIGSTIFLFHDHHYLFGPLNIVLAAIATPYVAERFKELNEIKKREK